MPTYLIPSLRISIVLIHTMRHTHLMATKNPRGCVPYPLAPHVGSRTPAPARTSDKKLGLASGTLYVAAVSTSDLLPKTAADMYSSPLMTPNTPAHTQTPTVGGALRHCARGQLGCLQIVSVHIPVKGMRDALEGASLIALPASGGGFYGYGMGPACPRS